MTSQITLPFAIQIGWVQYQVGQTINASDLNAEQIALINGLVVLSNTYPVIPLTPLAKVEAIKVEEAVLAVAADNVKTPEKPTAPAKKRGFFKSLFGMKQ
jgi:hypothetical protein